jgi:hypothetical protein
VTENAPTYPTEEYIAGRERGRSAGLKRRLKVRFTKIAGFTFFGGGFASIMIASPASTGKTSFSPPIAALILGGFIVVGILAGLRALHLYHRGIGSLRDDIVRSVVAPDDSAPQPGRFEKWWIRSDASGAKSWEEPAKTGSMNVSPFDPDEPR